jgi:hypothetical protein
MRVNQADSMKDDGDPAPMDLVSTNAPIAPRDPPTSWEPHEVWLTRVKIPRDLATLRQARSPAAQ